jgi:hypothetical protein
MHNSHGHPTQKPDGKPARLVSTPRLDDQRTALKHLDRIDEIDPVLFQCGQPLGLIPLKLVIGGNAPLPRASG